MRRTLLLGMLAGLGCSDTEIVPLTFDRTAVVSGDFDSVGALLQELDGDVFTLDELHTYDGRIVAPGAEVPVEELFADRGERPLGEYRALFLPCGMRGVGDERYDGSGPDDGLILDLDLLTRLRDAVRSGLHLYVSDWAYEWISLLWPGAVDWVGGGGLDDAQRGFAEELEAWVDDPDLATLLERSPGDAVDLTMNQSGWAVPTAPGPEVDVLVRAEVRYDDPDEPESGVFRWQADVPLAFVVHDGAGTVVFTAFHHANQEGDGRLVMRHLLSLLATGPVP